MGDKISEKTIDLHLSQIKVHQTYKNLNPPLSHNYLCNQIQRITPEGVSILLSTHPILVAKRKDGYFLIAGKRSFDIAITILPADTTVPCKEVLTTSQETIKEIIITDIFVTNCFYSSREAKDIGDLFISINDFNLSDVLKKIMFINSKDDLRKLLSKSYNTVFPKKPSGDK